MHTSSDDSVSFTALSVDVSTPLTVQTCLSFLLGLSVDLSIIIGALRPLTKNHFPPSLYRVLMFRT